MGRKLKIAFISIHPEFVEGYFRFGVFKALMQSGQAEITAVNLRDFAIDNRGTVDDTPYGGGSGMVLRVEPLVKAVRSFTNPFVILPSPAGKLWQDHDARALSNQFLSSPEDQTFVFIAGRFSGMDQRFVDQYVHLKVSLGDFVISGGELACLTVCDSILRFIPGALGSYDNADIDSFAPHFAGGLMHPLYTKPEEFEGQKVPDVLRSGDHKKIEAWRQKAAVLRTEKAKRFR